MSQVTAWGQGHTNCWWQSQEQRPYFWYSRRKKLTNCSVDTGFMQFPVSLEATQLGSPSLQAGLSLGLVPVIGACSDSFGANTIQIHLACCPAEFIKADMVLHSSSYLVVLDRVAYGCQHMMVEGCRQEGKRFCCFTIMPFSNELQMVSDEYVNYFK